MPQDPEAVFQLGGITDPASGARDAAQPSPGVYAPSTIAATGDSGLGIIGHPKQVSLAAGTQGTPSFWS